MTWRSRDVGDVNWKLDPRPLVRFVVASTMKLRHAQKFVVRIVGRMGTSKAIVNVTPNARNAGSPITPQTSVGGTGLAAGVGCGGMLRSAAGPSSEAAQMIVHDRESPGETTGQEETTEPVTSVEGQVTSREIACQTSRNMHRLPVQTDWISVKTTDREMTATANGGFL